MHLVLHRIIPPVRTAWGKQSPAPCPSVARTQSETYVPARCSRQRRASSRKRLASSEQATDQATTQAHLPAIPQRAESSVEIRSSLDETTAAANEYHRQSNGVHGRALLNVLAVAKCSAFGQAAESWLLQGRKMAWKSRSIHCTNGRHELRKGNS